MTQPLLGKSADAIGGSRGIGRAAAIAFAEAALRPCDILLNKAGMNIRDSFGVTRLKRGRGPEWKARISASLPLGRLGQPEGIAATAVLLAGPGRTSCAGGCLPPNGGDLLH